MTVLEMITALMEGNPGALSVLIQCLEKAKQIDPTHAFQELGPFIVLDSYGIYGPNIWVLYKDICEQNLVRFIAVLRCCQLGLVDRNQIFSLTPPQILELVKEVKARLPEFDTTGSVEPEKVSDGNQG